MPTRPDLSPTSRRRLVLAPRARLVPASMLEPSRRAELSADEDDVLAGVVGASDPSLLISAELAELVELFRRPATVFEAASRLARRRGARAGAILEAGRQPLRELIDRGVLEPAEASHAVSPPLFSPGERPLRGLRIVQPVHRLDGSEIYLARLDDGRRAALKIETRAAGKGKLERELGALERLRGAAVPELYASGRLRSKPWLLRGWVDGVDVLRAGLSARCEDRALGAGGIRLLQLLRRVARAFAGVHEHGLLHGDVHHGNVLVDRHGKVWLIDFALAGDFRACDPAASTTRGGETIHRAGSLLSIEPEQARALLDGRGDVAATPLGEQFAVGALLYETACGVPYMDFRLDRAGLLEQIAEARALPFAHHGVAPWPALESILRRALEADGRQRFPDMDALAGALERLPPQRQRRRSRARLPAVARRLRRRLRLLARIDDELGPSIYDGAAGVAYALLRLAGQLERPAALAAAESWLDEATLRSIDAAKKRRVGPISLFHTHAGVAVVDALLGHALGDTRRRARAIGRFIERSEPAAEAELMLGRAGSLLAAGLLRGLGPEKASRRALELAGDAWADAVLREHDERGPLREATYWGMAHGWAGELYALLRWFGAGGRTERGLDSRLLELADLSSPRGRGAMWPQPGGGPLTGWCHGSAGYVFLWHAAARWAAAESGLFRELASLAAWDAFEGPGEDGSLCCGLTGRAFSLLHHARLSGDERWRQRAAALAESAAAASFPDAATSLFKGELSLVLLDAELHGAEELGFPFFGLDFRGVDAREGSELELCRPHDDAGGGDGEVG